MRGDRAIPPSPGLRRAKRVLAAAALAKAGNGAIVLSFGLRIAVL
jgi:hypothetical protein